MRKQDKSGSSPTVKKHIDAKGRPTHQVTEIPGYGSKGTGTPSWVSKPAKAAEKKAK